MCRLRRLKSFFCLAAFHVPSSPHQHLSHSHWNKCPRYARPKQFQNSAFSWWFQAWGNFFQSSLLLKVCICTMTYNVYVAFLGVHAHVEPGEELKLWCNSPCLTWTPALRIVQSASKLIQTNLTLMKKLVSTFLILREFLVILQNFGFWMHFGSSWIHWEQRLLPSLIAHMPPI